MEGLYTTHDAARILQVHSFTVAKWIDRGELKAWRTAGGHRRVQAADLKAYLVEHGLPVPLELNGAGSRLRLLVVDGDARSRRGIQRDFEKLEAEVVVTTGSSGVDAVLLIAATRPDVVFLDLDVPDVDALDVFRQVRRVAALDSVTLLAMTAHHTPKVAAEAAKAGAALCHKSAPANLQSPVRQSPGAS